MQLVAIEQDGLLLVVSHELLGDLGRLKRDEDTTGELPAAVG